MANITLFNKEYPVRRYGEQKNVRGYLTSPFTDFIARLNVHPLSTDQIQALPEGERKIKRLEGHGSDVLVSANQSLNQQGDLLYYKGDWYECVSAQEWDHTILSHWNYQFVLVPKDASGSYDLTPPNIKDDADKADEEDNSDNADNAENIDGGIQE